jgi:hypothetical protein
LNEGERFPDVEKSEQLASTSGEFIMSQGLHFPKWATRSDRRTVKARRSTLGLSPYHRRLVCEALEDRRLLSVTAACDQHLLALIDQYAPSYYNSAWNLNIEQYKAWIATIAAAEGGDGGYGAHSQGLPGVDVFAHTGDASFTFSTGIGPFQLDRGGDDNWGTWPTIDKLNPVKAVETVMQQFEDHFAAGSTLANFADASPWYGVNPNQGGDPAANWLAVTGTAWDSYKDGKVLLDWSGIEAGLAANATAPTFQYANNVVDVGYERWTIGQSDNLHTASGTSMTLTGLHETWLITARSSSGTQLFQYYYTYDATSKVEVWALDNAADPTQAFSYIFFREYGTGPLPAHSTSPGDTLASPALTLNGAMAPPTAKVSTPTGPQNGNVPIAYSLADAYSDPCSIAAEYSVDRGVTWSAATPIAGQGDGMTGLSSSPSGTSHTFVWDAGHDLGNGTFTNVQVRLTPSNPIPGTADTTATFTVTVSLGDVKLTTDSAGQFSLDNSDGKPLLYPSFTGFLSVRIDGGDVFTNDDGGFGNNSGGLVVASQQGSSFVYAPVDGVQITENLIVQGDALKIEVVAQNVDTVNHSVQIRQLFDTQVDDNDGAPLYENGNTFIHEADFSPPLFTQWRSWRRPDDQSVVGVGTIDPTTTTRVVFGYWPTAIGTTWDYTANPAQAFYTPGKTTSPDSDSCVLVYQNAGTLVPSATGVMDTWYGSGAPAATDPREALLNAIQTLQTAISRYQQGCIAVISQADVAVVREIAQNSSLRANFEALGTNLLAGNLAAIVGGLATNSVGASADWLTNNLVPDLLTKLADPQLRSAVAGMVQDWFDGPNAIHFDWSDAQISAYISDYFQANDGLGAILVGTATLGTQISAQIPATLPADFPAQQITQSLISLANSIENLVPQVGRAAEDEAVWALPDTSPLGATGNLDPVLFGVSSYAAQDLQTAATLVGTDGSVDDVCRLADSAWTTDGGLVNVVNTLTVAGALPGQALYWGGTNTFSTAGTAASVLNLLATPYGFFEQYQGATTLDSDLLLARDFFNAIGNQLVSLTSEPPAQSSNLTVTSLSVPDVTSGWVSGVASASATLTVDNADPSLTGVARAEIDIYALDNGQYGNLVERVSSGGDLTIPSSQSSTFHFNFQVPSGSLFSSAHYLARFTIVSSAGVLTADAMFTACQPSADVFADVGQTIDTRLLDAGHTHTVSFQADPAAKFMEFVLDYPGGDMDLHVYDSQGRHVGVDYETGLTDLQIPGATYSGTTSRPERIVVPVTGDGKFTVETVAVTTPGPESYSVVANSVVSHPATLNACVVEIDASGAPNSLASAQFGISEIGGQNPITGLSVTISALTGPGGTTIPASALTCSSPSTIPAGGEVNGSVLIPVPDVGGVFTGTLHINSDQGSIDLPLRLDSNVQAVVQTPTVTAISPVSGAPGGGTTVTITGTNLTGATAVKFGSIVGTIQTDTATQIVVTAPAGAAGTVDVTVTTAGGTSATSPADRFSYGAVVQMPTVTGISPTSWSTAGGTTATITGTNLAGATAVKFGNVTATIQSKTATRIVVIVPAGAQGPVHVTVTTAGGTSATSPADQFTYVTGTPQTPTVGLYDPTSSMFMLRNTNDSGFADEVCSYGVGGAGLLPIVGDWTGDGIESIGLYDPVTSTFYLRNTNDSGYANTVFVYGPTNSGYKPVVGDWNGDGQDSIGLYNPVTSTFYLRNTNSLQGPNDQGYADIIFNYGAANSGMLPLAGDWDGSGRDGIGLYSQATSTFYLRESTQIQGSNDHGYADAVLSYGAPQAGLLPIAGDWNGDGLDGIGLYDQSSSTFFLRNAIQLQGPSDHGFSDINFMYGQANHLLMPVAGEWTGALVSKNLLAAGGAVVASPNTPVLTQDALQPIVNAAIARWTSVGMDAETVAKLRQVQFVIGDLPGSTLGEADGSLIRLDANAAGNGWFVDPTPNADEEFTTASSSGQLQAVDSRALDRMDLLTVVEHELGHVAGLGDLDSSLSDLMSSTLNKGIRRNASVSDVDAVFAGYGRSL